MFLLFLFLVGILRRFLKGIIGKLFLSLSLSVLGCIFSELQHAPKVVYIHQRRWASPYWPSCRFWGWSWVTVCFFGKGGNREILKRNRGIFFLKVFWAIYFWSPDNARFQENHLGFIPFFLAGAAISLPLCLLMAKCCGPTLPSPSRSYGFRMLPMCVTCLLKTLLGISLWPWPP